MLEIKDIRKEYITGDLHQTALDGVSLSFRDSEFVAVLGPSGSGKTTLLNVVGGLDRYDSGDLIINGISTKKYKDRDWDSYRNHTIGFVFQSYNLIPHQSVLANVELALTISGISRSERKRRAKEALERVGLGDQLHKRPNQMSGGQMQRVAIARALVNDPDILLADEPTGALDSDTSLQVMDMLAEVAKDRLVIMVTHNPELAERYATRTVRLRDGRITDDSAPFEPVRDSAEPEHRSMGKASMSVTTSLGLSFNNLRTKKGRTLLTSFAGSIGIIGIAMILSMSNGVNNYIADIQKDTMSSYPIDIESRTFDYSAFIEDDVPSMRLASPEAEHELDGVYADGSEFEEEASFNMSIMENNLTAFKKYLDDGNSEIHKYVGENGIVYNYDTRFGVYTYDSDGTFVNTDGSTLDDDPPAFGSMAVNSYTPSMIGGSSEFSQLISGKDGSQVGAAITDSYEVVYGRYPERYDELVLVLDANNELSATTLYELGILPTAEYRDIMERIADGEEVKAEMKKLSYEEICGHEFRLIPKCDMYEKNEKGFYEDISGNNARLERLYGDGIPMKIVGIIRPSANTDSNRSHLLYYTVGYTRALTDYLIDYTGNSEVVKAQKASPERSVTNGLSFVAEDDAAKAENARIYISSLNTSDKASLFMTMIEYMGLDLTQTDMSGLPEGFEIPAGYGDTDGFTGMSESDLSEAMDLYLSQPDEETLVAIYDMYIYTIDYDETLSEMGMVSLDAPSSISIYADNFEDKDAISRCIEEYNNSAAEQDRIFYTDYVGMIMSSVTDIINVISYVLISFVAVSLVVSSIMIGIITYISVLERTKEIGILRAIGASKRNISQVFNAETFIIGLCSGLIGIGATLILLVPANVVIHAMTGTNGVNASLPPLSALVLIGLSILLTLIGGFLPAKKAAKKDPVTALRTE